jgi:hypothetical protein
MTNALKLLSRLEKLQPMQPITECDAGDDAVPAGQRSRKSLARSHKSHSALVRNFLHTTLVKTTHEHENQ